MRSEIDAGRKLRQVFQTKATVGIFPASGTGAWESALVNVLVPGDRILLTRIDPDRYRFVVRSAPGQGS